MRGTDRLLPMQDALRQKGLEWASGSMESCTDDMGTGRDSATVCCCIAVVYFVSRLLRKAGEGSG